MKRIFSLLISFVLPLLLVSTAFGQTSNSVWDATLTSPQGSFDVKITVKRDGNNITGTVKSQAGESPFKGTINDKDIRLNYSIDYMGNDLPITLTGTIDGNSIKGKVDYGGFADGDWTAKLVGDAPASATKPSAPPTAEKSDVSGKWTFQVETEAGTGTPEFTFKQNGETLTGQYKGTFGEAPLTGTVKGSEIKFTITVDVQGQNVSITYVGTIEKDSMKGTADLGGLGKATWTGKRQ
jgi:hypothetical protein